MDTNVMVVYVPSKSDKTLVCAVFDKMRKSGDAIIVTDQVMEELYRIDRSHRKMDARRITAALRKLNPKLVFIQALHENGWNGARECTCFHPIS